MDDFGASGGKRSRSANVAETIGDRKLTSTADEENRRNQDLAAVCGRTKNLVTMPEYSPPCGADKN